MKPTSSRNEPTSTETIPDPPWLRSSRLQPTLGRWFLAAAASALLCGPAAAQTSPNESLTNIPDAPGSSNTVVYDIARKKTRTIVAPTQPPPAQTTEPYPGADLQGLSFNLDGFGDGGDPLAYPARVNVDIDNDLGTSCTGTLIDARHVITAGHCVYDDGAWITGIKVNPGNSWYYGSARAITLTTFEGWKSHGYHNWDIGLITLDRPIGALTGWHGYGTASCSTLTSNEFANFSFPVEGPEPQEWAFWSGSFDWCPTSYIVQRNVVTYGGMSGSSIYDSGFHVRAIHSTHYFGWPEGGRSVRLTDSTFDVIFDTIQSHRPASADLIPVGLDTDRENVFPNVGDKLNVTGIHVHNYSKANFNGPMEVHVKLSSNDNISGSDLTLWSASGNYSIDAMESETFNPGDLVIPDGIEGQYWVGVWINAADSNTSNNTGSEVLGEEMQPVYVTDAWWDLQMTDVQPTLGEYDTWEDLPVTFGVRNDGPYDSLAWNANFYLSTKGYTNDEAYFLAKGQGPGLESSEFYMTTVDLPLIGVEPGKYYVWVEIVADDEVVSSNNLMAGDHPIFVKDLSDLAGPAPNLRVNYLGTISGAYNKTDQLPAAFSIGSTSTNAGVWHAHFFAVNASGDIVHLASGSANQLLSGDSFDSVENLPLSKLSVGTWSLVIGVETNGETTFADNWRVAAQTFTILPGLAIE